MEQDKVVELLKQRISELEASPDVIQYLEYKQTLKTIYSLIKGGEGKNGKLLLVDTVQSKMPTKEAAGLTNKQLVALIFKEAGRFLHVREVLEIASKKAPGVDEKSIRQAIYGLRIDGTIVSKAINNSNLNTFWGSPKWLSAEGEIKPEYSYNENYVTKKESIQI